LKTHAPADIKFVSSPSEADLRVVHVIGNGSFDGVNLDQPHVLIQYCLRSTENGGDPEVWVPRWRRARMVWSYYKLNVPADVNFYHSPLGVDDPFREEFETRVRDIGVVTSGYVAESEAVEEVAIAASLAGLRAFHLGPANVLAKRPSNWVSAEGITDAELASVYRRTYWVSGLRRGEGFELPALEGVACGARPIVFDREDMRQWYENHAVFVPECGGRKLIGYLLDIFKHAPVPVTKPERVAVLSSFDWARIASEFWKRLEVVHA
jgi:hypothetical protein